jgi:hypothetical protein
VHGVHPTVLSRGLNSLRTLALNRVAPTPFRGAP